MAKGERQRAWNVDSLRRLVQQLQGTDVDDLEVVRGEFRLRLRREPGFEVTPRESPLCFSEDDVGIAIVAPLTGVFYACPGPDEQPYVNVGDLVESGHVVALIETMKLFNEVATDTGGVIIEIQAQNGDLVETGQILFRMMPGDRELLPLIPPPTA
ncbi:MAG: acetyl-CoA carboxylase biotin carboxyl carrier protein [Chloroflexota bacterium]